MSEKQRIAQQERRAREKAENHAATQAAKAAEIAASRVPDGPVEFQPDPNAAQDAFARNRPEGEREFKRGNPVRSAAYEEIMASRRQQQEDTVHEEPRPTTEPEPVAAAPVPVPSPKPTPDPDPEPEMVRVKVDGEEFSVPKSEVDELGGIKQYQIFKAQEKRLQESRQLASDLNRMFQQMQAAQKPPEPVKKPEEDLRDIVTKIQLGTPEEGAQALQQALQNLAPKPVDPQSIAYQAFMLSQVTAAENAFVRDNKDLIENQLLRNLVISEKNRRLAELQAQKRLPDDWNAFYNQIALDIRTAIGRPTTAPQTVHPASQPTSGVAEKEARKASILALPTAATRAAAPEAEKPLTRDEILARARAARGQPV